ncbi:hypothetical protein E2C01_092553 [Portunus trituberculatus]|uniref:Uncharacterized protein n=1 Tax=Portunus trituberculatus TaxID=210409 RepID=A0A5B7JQV5_PORTR|nr:hypothetical protein [Portunus trituberculatus]
MSVVKLSLCLDVMMQCQAESIDLPFTLSISLFQRLGLAKHFLPATREPETTFPGRCHNISRGAPDFAITSTLRLSLKPQIQGDHSAIP